MTNLSRLFRTVRYLKPAQIVYRLWRSIRPRRIASPPNVALRSREGKWMPPIARQQTMRAKRDFNILNQDISVASPSAWNDASRDKLLLYHLHYMDDLTAAGASCRTGWHSELIDQWIEENPPVDGNGWEPYPLSRRIVNWVKWQLAGNALSDNQLSSLWTQAHILNQSIEYHLQANHLLANAVGLCFAGAFFDDREAERWLRKGSRLLAAQVAQQILADGGHFERSPMYHAVILEDLLDIVNVSRIFGFDVPDCIGTAIPAMLRWLACMTHPDGEPAYFNDTVAANAASLSDLMDYASRLELVDGNAVPAAEGLQSLPESGYFCYSRKGISVFVDSGYVGPDFQPGHAHCDCLSFELSVGSGRVFVNTGISTYNDCPRRHFERGTAAHNTVSIDGLEQSEIWSAFRVGRRARPFDVSVGEHNVAAAHDGYKDHGIIHRRNFDFLDDQLVMRDSLESRRSAKGRAHFHCHPDVEPLLIDGDVQVGDVRLAFDNASDIDVQPYEYCQGFNDRRAARKIVVTFESTLTSRFHYENSVHLG